MPSFRSTAVALLLGTLLCAPAAGAEELNLFDWVARAPLVVSGTSRGETGKLVAFEAERALRGETPPAAVLLIDLRSANRERDRGIDREALRLDAGARYVLLLEPAFVRKKDGATIYRLVRGSRGALPLPPEGAEALVAALDRFVAMQDVNSDTLLWQQLSDMLEETDPRFLETALDEFLRYRRGTPDLLPLLRPVFDHPGPTIREKAVRLAGQIVLRHDAVDLPAERDLRAELIARARRDEAVPVRVAATEALRGFGGAEIAAVLREISDDDPDQSVRYAAELILLDRRRERDPGEGEPDRSD